MIEAVLFDLDGTLYDRDALARRIFESQYRAFATELAGVERERFVRDLEAMDDHGHGDKGAGYRRLAAQWQLGSDLAARLIEHFWNCYDGFDELPEETRSTLAALRERGLKLGVITNGASVRQRRKLTGLGLAEAFDVIVVSGEEGVRKPEPEIFARALSRCGVGAATTMFVGDHPVADVAGAQRAGLMAVWRYVPYWSPVVADAPVIARLPQVLRLL